MTRLWLLVALLSAAAAAVAYIAWDSFQVTGRNGFPLDDPWIHLQFARNLHDTGVFSFNRGEPPTSGATGPLYTFLLAGAFSFTRNEYLMSYALGIAFYLLSAIYLYRVADRILANSWWALLTVLLYLFEPRIQWIALSGMETTLFLFLLLFTTDHYFRRNGWGIGFGAALLLWTRPEAVLFAACMALDATYAHFAARERAVRSGVTWTRPAVAIFTLGLGAYALFNWRLSGSLFPNTLAAKLAYYGQFTGHHFPLRFLHYLADGYRAVLASFALIGTVALAGGLAKGRPDLRLMPLLWCLGLFAAYWIKLPHLYQEGRYLIPMLPFFLLFGTSGMREACRSLPSRRYAMVVAGVTAFAVAALTLNAAWMDRRHHELDSEDNYQRHVVAAIWIRDHLPPTAIIGTHDVGAIAYYSNRRVVDMAGLISPQAIPLIGHDDQLIRYLEKRKVTHLAVLDSWFAVANQTPLFQCGSGPGTVMKVYPFLGEATHFRHPLSATTAKL